MHSNASTVRLTQLSLLAAIEVLLSFTPLGFIPLPAISITTLHIPVIIGAIILGPKDGGILGFVMGVCSLLRTTFAPSGVTAILISPFTSGAPVLSIIMVFVPRILIGVAAGYTYIALKKRHTATALSVGIAAAAGTLTNSVLFLGMMSIFFSSFPLINVLSIIVGVNCISEIIAAIVISIGVCLPLLKYMKKKVIA